MKKVGKKTAAPRSRSEKLRAGDSRSRNRPSPEVVGTGSQAAPQKPASALTQRGTVATVRLPALPGRPVEGHKGLFGRVLVVGGSTTMVGAPVLAGTAALRMGSGLVQVAMPDAVLPAALSITPELIGLSDRADLTDAANKADVVVLGPGLGVSDSSRERVHALVRVDRPMVIDADALNVLAEGNWPADFAARAVLTPHPGEMKRLCRGEVPTEDGGRTILAVSFARKVRQVLVLKGHRTVVTDGSRVYVNDTGDSSLSKAGSGDVLSGIIGSLIGQGMERFEAAVAGVWLHGRAGEMAGEGLGRRCVLARDVIDALPDAIEEYEGGE